MKTIALRFGEHFAPNCGTITAHQALIDKTGYVWYGKMGAPVANSVINDLKEQETIKILLVNSGKFDRYWAYVDEIKKEIPELDCIPEYYRGLVDKFKTWFRITKFEPAPKDIMSKCHVISSGKTLGEVSKHSMNPYFIINYEDKKTE